MTKIAWQRGGIPGAHRGETARNVQRPAQVGASPEWPEQLLSDRHGGGVPDVRAAQRRRRRHQPMIPVAATDAVVYATQTAPCALGQRRHPHQCSMTALR